MCGAALDARVTRVGRTGAAMLPPLTAVYVLLLLRSRALLGVHLGDDALDCVEVLHPLGRVVVRIAAFAFGAQFPATRLSGGEQRG